MTSMRHTNRWPQVIAALTLLLLAVGEPGVAHADSSATATTAGFDTDQCIGALPRPDCGSEPRTSGDRGGWEQFVLLGVVVAALVFIGSVVVRSSLRTQRARRERAPAGPERTTTSA